MDSLLKVRRASDIPQAMWNALPKRAARNRSRATCRRVMLEALEPRALLTTISETLIARGAIWNYLDDGSNQGTSADGAAWFAHPDYDDTASGPAGAWEQGPAELGYGDSQTTLIDFVDADPSTGGTQKNATTYFRRTFEVADPANYEYLIFLKYDDAAAIYINGVEAMRTDNLAADAEYNDYAINGQTVSVEEAYVRFDVSAEARNAMVAGENLIAVEIHQADSGSSDISFDLELSARAPASLAVTSEIVGSGFARPVYMTAAPGDTDRLFVLEQAGRIRILDLQTGNVAATPFLDISQRVRGNDDGGNEQGLLGLAFPPAYADKGYFYVNYTATSGSGDTVVSRFHLSGNPNVADPNSEEILLTVDQPFSNHNAGWIDFGPDGFLYIALGDGGSGNDPGNRAQDTTNQLLGKLLRIDVEGQPDPGRPYAIPPDNPLVGVTGDDEIWAYGLRNTWRNSFDRSTGDLYIADVGQNNREEINVQPANSAGGENYGWRVMEGNRCNNNGDAIPCNSPVFTPPVFDYPRPNLGGGDLIFEGASVTGGYVYRGPVNLLQGHYFFGDFVSSRIWSLYWDGSSATQLIDWTSQLVPNGGPAGVASFGEDNDGNVYFSDFAGNIRRIVLPDQPLAVRDVSINTDIADPPDLPAGPQPTSWSEQRSLIRSISITFSEPVLASSADLVLTNLGVDAPNEPDDVIPLEASQVVVSGNRVTIELASGDLLDGVYSLTVLPSVTELDGDALDGNGDGTRGDAFLLTGNQANRFYQFTADLDGELGVTIFDFPAFSYWFARSTTVAPEYLDFNGDQGISIFDFPHFSANFGKSVVFPVNLTAPAPLILAAPASAGEQPPTGGDERSESQQVVPEAAGLQWRDILLRPAADQPAPSRPHTATEVAADLLEILAMDFVRWRTVP